MGHYANAYRYGYLVNVRKQDLALGRAQQFAVPHFVHPGSVNLVGQDNGSRYHRAGQRASADFVYAGNKPVALRLEYFFLGKGWFEIFYNLTPFGLVYCYCEERQPASRCHSEE